MAVDVGAVSIQLKSAETELAKYAGAAKDLDNKMKKKMAEFQMVNQGLWEGKDHITDLEKELAAAKETFNKMVANKIGPIRQNLAEIGTTAGNTASMAKGLETRLAGLHKALDTATGTPQKLTTAYEQVKKLETGSNRVFVELNGMRLEIAGLAKTPVL